MDTPGITPGILGRIKPDGAQARPAEQGRAPAGPGRPRVRQRPAAGNSGVLADAFAAQREYELIMQERGDLRTTQERLNSRRDSLLERKRGLTERLAQYSSVEELKAADPELYEEVAAHNREVRQLKRDYGHYLRRRHALRQRAKRLLRSETFQDGLGEDVNIVEFMAAFRFDADGELASLKDVKVVLTGLEAVKKGSAGAEQKVESGLNKAAAGVRRSRGRVIYFRIAIETRQVDDPEEAAEEAAAVEAEIGLISGAIFDLAGLWNIDLGPSLTLDPKPDEPVAGRSAIGPEPGGKIDLSGDSLFGLAGVRAVLEAVRSIRAKISELREAEAKFEKQLDEQRLEKKREEKILAKKLLAKLRQMQQIISSIRETGDAGALNAFAAEVKVELGRILADVELMEYVSAEDKQVLRRAVNKILKDLGLRSATSN